MSIQSVHRALDILYLFSASRPRLGITDISRALKLPKTTIHGLVKTLVERGFLQQDAETRKYRLGLNIYELGTMLAGTLTINQVAAGPAQQLARATGSMARIAIWDRQTVLVTLNLSPYSQSMLLQQLGPRVPAYCSAIGKAILACLPEAELERYLEETRLAAFTPRTITDPAELRRDLARARSLGYAADQEEFLAGIACIGAAVFDGTGMPVASLSLSGGPDLHRSDNLGQMAQQLVQTAREVSMYMGYAPEAWQPATGPGGRTQR